MDVAGLILVGGRAEVDEAPDVAQAALNAQQRRAHIRLVT